MPTSKVMSLNEAVDLINNGDLITISGMTFFRNPTSFIAALVNSNKKDLSFVDREPGFGLDVLTAANKLKMIRAAMATFEHFGLSPSVRKAAERKQVDYLEDTCGAVIAGLRAGAQGVPFMPVRGVIGSDLVKIHEERNTWKIIKDPFTNEDIAIIKAIEPDVAVIHVHMSDEYGNAVILGPRYEDELKIRAAKKVIITAEKIVDKEELKKRNAETLSSTLIHATAVINAKNGAWPTAMYTMYEADYKAIKEYYEYAKEGRAMDWIKANLIKRWY
jgi:glutaconate CoA-transferase subunit A